MGFRKWCKAGFKKFCVGTSLHGFAELHDSSNCFQAVFWLLIVCGAAGITTYQVYESVGQFMNQNTMTVTDIVKAEDVLYPPLKVCLSHWMDWVDQEKAEKMKLTKEGLLFGLSYLSIIYSNQSFDISKAKLNFDKAYKSNKFAKMSDFFKALAVNPRTFVHVDDRFYTFVQEMYGEPGPSIFTKVEFARFEKTLLLCYVASGADVSKYFEEQKAIKKKISNQIELSNILRLVIYQYTGSDLGETLTPSEYNSYMAEWIGLYNSEDFNLNQPDAYLENFANAKLNYTNIKMPKYLFVNGFSQVGLTIVSDVENYFVNVKASAHKFKINDKIICDDTFRYIVTNMSCAEKCSLKDIFRGLSTFQCTRAAYSPMVFNQNVTENICKNNIVFINPSTGGGGGGAFPGYDAYAGFAYNSQQADESPAYMLSPAFYPTIPYDMSMSLGLGVGNGFSQPQVQAETMQPDQSSSENEKISKAAQDCYKSCVPGCEQWTYDLNVVTKSLYAEIKSVATKKATAVQIEYPPDNAVLIMTDTDSQSWENFVGNVGGILGIWTGASIVSMIQLFYLCCFTSCDCSSPNSRNSAVVNIQAKVKEEEMEKEKSTVRPVILSHYQQPLHPVYYH